MVEEIVSDVFVGREPELRELLAALDDVAAGRGRLILLSGEPGIGKSRLADELASRARDRGLRVLWGRAWEDAGAPPYWMWVQALRSYLQSARAEDVRRQLGSRAAEIGQMVPDVRDIVPDLPPAVPIDSDSARFQLFDSATAFLRAVAREGPLVIVLDDLQAADTPSLLFLRFVASQLADTAILLLGAYRDVELTDEHPLRRTLAELAREPAARLMPLRGLGADAVADYIQVTAGVRPRAQLVAALHGETGGNPLFVSEAIRLLEAEGRFNELAAGRLHVGVPAGIRDVIERRLEHIDPATVHLLTEAAVVGPEFSADMLRRIGGHGTEELLKLVEDASRAGLIVPARAAVGRYRFAHDLVRETLYGGISATERRRLHRRVAETLEELHGPSPDEHLAELAHHYFEAAQGGDVEPPMGTIRRAADHAASYARRAGDQASRSLAYEEAARLYTMALAVLEGQAAVDHGERAEILLALGDAQARAGDLPTARGSFLRAAAIARRRGDGAQLARAAVGYGGRFLWPRAGNDPHLIPLLQDALVMLGGSEERLRVRLLTRLACAWRGSQERRDQSDALSQQAVDIARSLSDPWTLCVALLGRYGAIYWPDNAEERLPIAEELLATAQAVEDPERIVDAHMTLVFSYCDLGRMAEARSEIDRLTRVAVELRQPAQMWLSNSTRTAFALLSGDYAAAEKLMAVESEPGHPSTPVEDDVSAMRMHRFLLGRERGRVADEEESVRDAAIRFPWYPCHRAALAGLLADTAQLDEARAVFAELAADFDRLVRDNEWLLAMALAADACRLVGNADAAAHLYDQLTPFAGMHAIGHPEGSLGGVDRYLGLLAELLGRLDDAERHLIEGIRVNERLGAPTWRAHTMADLAALLGRRARVGDRDRAMQLRTEALDIAERLGMTALARRLGSPPSTAQEPRADAAAPGAAPAKLRREGDYWSVRFGGAPFRLRDMKGLRYLARLLERPGQELHVLDLIALEAPAEGRRPGGGARDPALEGDGRGAIGPGLDAQAKAEYRARLEELQDELAEAEQWNDPEREARARQELELLADQLAGAVGLGGRDRPTGSAAERARVSVTRAIHGAIARLGEHDRDLHAHLRATIRTGTYCSYQPDPRVPLEWRL